MTQGKNPRFNDASAGPQVPGKPQRTGLKTFILIIVLLLAAMIIIHETILQITTVTIVGNKNVSRSEILSLAGFDKRVSYLNVRENDIAENINSHPLLDFENIEKHFPSSVTIYVKERIPCANMMLMGSQYILDQDGHVLLRCEEKNLSNGLLCVTGINVKKIAIGEKLIPVLYTQMEAYHSVISELEVQNRVGEFSELNVSDSDNIYLVTLDGYSVRLGDFQDMRGKLLTVRGCLGYLRDHQYKAGTLDASVPGYATYTPPNL